jgi:hypothetical protein
MLVFYLSSILRDFTIYVVYFLFSWCCDRTLPPELTTLYKFFNLFLLLLDIKLVMSVSYPSWLIRLVGSHHWQLGEQI